LTYSRRLIDVKTSAVRFALGVVLHVVFGGHVDEDVVRVGLVEFLPDQALDPPVVAEIRQALVESDVPCHLEDDGGERQELLVGELDGPVTVRRSHHLLPRRVEAVRHGALKVRVGGAAVDDGPHPVLEQSLVPLEERDEVLGIIGEGGGGIAAAPLEEHVPDRDAVESPAPVRVGVKHRGLVEPVVVSPQRHRSGVAALPRGDGGPREAQRKFARDVQLVRHLGPEARLGVVHPHDAVRELGLEEPRQPILTAEPEGERERRGVEGIQVVGIYLSRRALVVEGDGDLVHSPDVA